MYNFMMRLLAAVYLPSHGLADTHAIYVSACGAVEFSPTFSILCCEPGYDIGHHIIYNFIRVVGVAFSSGQPA